MAGESENKGLPFQPFHRPRSHTGGSAWLLSGTILACGVALPGLCLAWHWKQTNATKPVPLMIWLVVVDAIFVLTATAFLSTGGLFGRQRYGVTQNYPGPFKEQDGAYFPPAFVQPYVMTAALLFGVITPTIVLGYLLWRSEMVLGVCTVGLYLLEVAAQLISETLYVRKGSVMWPQVPHLYQTYRIWQLIRGCYIVGVLHGPDWLWALQAGLLVLWVFNSGVVMSWTPWLYRWHLQPDSSQKPFAK